jgi:hypothetical protein
MENKGYKVEQVKGLTTDKYYDYLGPRLFAFGSLKELPTDPAEKDIYEPIRVSFWSNGLKNRMITLKLLLCIHVSTINRVAMIIVNEVTYPMSMCVG